MSDTNAPLDDREFWLAVTAASLRVRQVTVSLLVFSTPLSHFNTTILNLTVTYDLTFELDLETGSR